MSRFVTNMVKKPGRAQCLVKLRRRAWQVNPNPFSWLLYPSREYISSEGRGVWIYWEIVQRIMYILQASKEFAGRFM